ncbi:uncharacterized protein LOC132031977 [Lycium ferocissimum]|uniref:uncharacterized protein LOC132031977 n=1 Tax=Lycium ferocissimum TaxID=112874 RepID=UPI0028168986|nr:uncharacterized protein LOC132031977 [Lycium ferocissimum]
MNFLVVCTTNVHPNVSAETVKLKLFPFYLTGEATAWLDDLPAGFITTWAELTQAFLKKFFPPSRMLQLRDEINNFRQLPTEALHEAWTHLKKKVNSCPKHGLPDSVLLQTFYRSLDTVNKSVANNIVGGFVMENSYAVMSALLDILTETNEAWHTREMEVDGGGPSKIVLSRETIKKEEERDETMAKLVTQMDLLTKHVLGGGSKRVNVVGSCEGDSMDEHCFQVCEEEANFINNQAGGSRPNYQGPNQGSWRQGQGNQDWNKDSENQGWSKDSGNSHWRDKKQGGYHNNQGGYNNNQGSYNNNYNNHRSSNPYVP